MPDDLLDRFFGRVAARSGAPAADPRLTDPVGLQCLLEEPLNITAGALTRALREYHADMMHATAELHAVALGEVAGELHPAVLGLIAWGPHVLKLVGFDAPMPADAVAACVRPAHFDPAYKELAYRHRAHVLLYYAGYDRDPLEQYVALAAVAGVMAFFGATTTLNETARTALPAAALLPHEEDGGDVLTALRRLPLPLLYCGFVKLEVEGEAGVWMRTCGGHRFGLPDLALRAAGHEEGTRTFELFGNLLSYQRATGRPFVPGDTLQLDDDLFLRLREPTANESYLTGEGETLVAEPAPK